MMKRVRTSWREFLTNRALPNLWKYTQVQSKTAGNNIPQQNSEYNQGRKPQLVPNLTNFLNLVP